MYVHRILRLTPAFAAAILFSYTLAKYMGNGPMWNTFSGYASYGCDKYWWSALLYVQNYVNPDTVVSAGMMFFFKPLNYFLFTVLRSFVVLVSGYATIFVITDTSVSIMEVET